MSTALEISHRGGADTGRLPYEIYRLFDRTEFASGVKHLSAIAMPAGANTLQHSHAEEELFVVLEGRGSVQVGTDVHSVTQGDVVLVAPNIEHQIRSAGTGPDQLTVLAITFEAVAG